MGMIFFCFTSSRIEEQSCSKRKEQLENWETGPGAELSARSERRKSLANENGVRQQPVARESQIQQNKINKETDWTHKTKIDFFIAIKQDSSSLLLPH
jgi:hypothetical protein